MLLTAVHPVSMTRGFSESVCDIAKGEFLQLLSEKRSTQSQCKIIIIISELTTRPETSYHSTTLVTFNSHQIFNSDLFEIILSCNIQIYFKKFIFLTLC